MTNENRENLITSVTKLLESISDVPPRAGSIPSAAPDTVELLTVKECCEVVKGLTDYTMRQLISRGEIPSVRCGKGTRGKILVPKAALLAYFNGAGR